MFPVPALPLSPHVDAPEEPMDVEDLKSPSDSVSSDYSGSERCGLCGEGGAGRALHMDRIMDGKWQGHMFTYS